PPWWPPPGACAQAYVGDSAMVAMMKNFLMSRLLAHPCGWRNTLRPQRNLCAQPVWPLHTRPT
ncbi:MAG: hypothetical protein OXU20_00880, partial [Myxococcales bacterium]|nr:hypothetical protein [Myxococcales bacterium]